MNLGGMDGLLVIKLIEPNQDSLLLDVASSARSHLLLPKTQSHVGAAAARKADATVGQKLHGFNPADRVLDQTSEFLALVVADYRAQILNFDHVLAHETT